MELVSLPTTQRTPKVVQSMHNTVLYLSSVETATSLATRHRQILVVMVVQFMHQLTFQ